MHVAKGKEPIGESYLLYDSNFMTFWKRKNYGDRRKISSFQGLGEGCIGRAQGIFRTANVFYIMWNGGYIVYLSKSIESTMQRVNPNVNCGF